MLKAFDWSPWIKAITIKLYCCTSSFNWWFKFRFIWSQRNCCIFITFTSHICNIITQIGICVNIVRCWSWILRIWNPAGESHEGRHSNAALIILETIWSSLPSSLSAPQQFKERKVAGKGTIHVETPGLYLYIWRPFLFSLYCYQDIFWNVMKSTQA